MAKKTPPINFIVSLHICPFDVMVSIGQDDAQVEKVLTSKYGLVGRDIEISKYIGERVQGKACMFSNNASFIRLRKLPEYAEDFGYLAHEIFHVVTFVMEATGMELVIMKSDEAYAYLIQYLTEQIYKQTNKYY